MLNPVKSRHSHVALDLAFRNRFQHSLLAAAIGAVFQTGIVLHRVQCPEGYAMNTGGRRSGITCRIELPDTTGKVEAAGLKVRYA